MGHALSHAPQRGRNEQEKHLKPTYYWITIPKWKNRSSNSNFFQHLLVSFSIFGTNQTFIFFKDGKGNSASSAQWRISKLPARRRRLQSVLRHQHQRRLCGPGGSQRLSSGLTWFSFWKQQKNSKASGIKNSCHALLSVVDTWLPSISS